jgi:cellulose synthase/poly-beta-1,6-N-acetylglucosamine synthase-like glycosyltransferase
MIVIRVIEICLLVYFGYTTLYALVFFIGGLFYRDKKFIKLQGDQQKKYCVLIPSYKEDGVIVGVAEAALKQNYPAELYRVVVVADSLQQATVEKLRSLPITTVVVKFESSTKIKSLNEALRQVGDDFDYVVILDADNVMEPDFLWKVNYLHSIGYRSVQAQRAPKNAHSSMAVLDGISESVNYSIISKGGTALNASPGVKGSGVSFEFKPIKNIFAAMDSVGGFDRELELKLIENDMTIYFSSDTLVMDEKVGSMEVFKKQRTRWISSQFFYLRKYFGKGMQALLRFDLVYFNSAILRNIQLPRLLNIGLLGAFMFLLFFARNYLAVNYLVWPALFATNVFIILFSIPGRFYNKNLLKAVLELPSVFINMFLIMFKLKNANKKFIHTPHSTQQTKTP